MFFAKSYHINKMDINSKYKTKAAQYYRQIIRSEVMSYDPPDNIALNDAKEVLDDIENVYEEFENYSSVKHVNLDLLEKNVKKAKFTLKGLDKKSTYWVKVRAFKKVNGVKKYGKWSSAKKKKIKK